MKLIASIVALTAAVSLTSCSGGGQHTHAAASSSKSANLATRWWSDGSQAAGSTIDPKDPAAAATKLHPSRQTYCAMLKATLSAGHSILPGATATSPALLTSTEAFIAELQSVAPTEVSASWKVLGATVLSLVKSGGKSGTTASPSAIGSAVATVADDAKARCGVNLAA